jgi:hypothetical protein
MQILRRTALFALCLVTVLCVRVLLWVTRYQRIRGWLVRSCTSDPQPERRGTVVHTARAIRRAARLVPDASCLTQSISCQALLSWRGIPSTIAMGVRKGTEGDLRVHAWLVWNDLVVLEGDEDTPSDFSTIARLPTPIRPS